MVFGYQDRKNSGNPELYETGGPKRTSDILSDLYGQRDAAGAFKEKYRTFLLPGRTGKAVWNYECRGGFYYVGAMHDSFPHALEISRLGYHGFALIYRTREPYDDLARAICFLHDHAAEFQMDPNHYSLWGGSAGARMAAVLGNRDYLRQLTDRSDIQQAAAVIMQYTGYSSASYSEVPTYACVGTRDGLLIGES